MPHSQSSRSRSFVALLILATLQAAPSKAATRVVTTLDDSSPNGLSATVAASAPGDVITFAPGLAGTIVLAASPLTIGIDLEVRGPGPTTLTVRPGAASRAILVQQATVTISGLEVLPHSASGNGGIHNQGVLTLRNVSVRGSHDGTGSLPGGGVRNDATLMVIESEVSTCAGSFGAGLYTGPGSKLQVWSSTVAENSGVYGAGICGQDAEIELVNVTLSGNGADFGGGIYVSGGSLSVTGSTVVGNTSSGQFSGAAGIHSGSTSVTLRSSVVALNRGHDGLFRDFFGCCLMDSGFNLIGSAIDPMLGPLQYAGGFARVRVPLPGSPLIDQGHSSGYPFDERLYGRPFDDPAASNPSAGDGSDIGAVEANASVVGVGPRATPLDLRITSLAPNPMRTATRIGFILPQNAQFRLAVLSIDGRKVRDLANGWREGGPGVATWDGTDERGVQQPAGIYLVRIEAAGSRVTKKLVLVP